MGRTAWLHDKKMEKFRSVLSRGGAVDKLHLTKACRHSSQRELSGGEIDEGGEAVVCFVVAGRDPTVLLQIAEEVLDQVTPARPVSFCTIFPATTRAGSAEEDAALSKVKAHLW